MALFKETGRYTSFYNSWASMRQRCLDKNGSDFKNYGGRGITFCDRWEKFDNFHKDMYRYYKKGLSLDRKDNDGNYNKENCRWVTSKIQNNNSRHNKPITFKGITKNLNQWAEYFKIKRSTLAQRYYVYKWDLNKCFNY